MEKRLVLAIVLVMLVVLLPSLLWPPKQKVRGPAGRPDSATVNAVSPAPGALATPPAQPERLRPRAPDATESPADTIWVASDLYRLGFSTRGAKLVSAELRGYASFAPGDSGRPVQIVPTDRPMLAHRFEVGPDTLDLSSWSFTPSETVVQVDGIARLTFTAQRGPVTVSLEYRFASGDYRVGVRGTITGVGPGVLALGLGDGLRSVEADSADDAHHLGVVTKAAKPQNTSFSSLDSAETRELAGPLEWVAFKSKYFLAVALTIEEGEPQFGGAVAVGGPRQGRLATRAAVTVTLPVPRGQFDYQAYLGPLDQRRLAAIGHDLDDVNPYGWILRPVIQPVTVFVVNIMLWMHERLSLAYGWVLVIFGVLVRVLLWPLNQKAMESSMRMQAVQPILQDIQKRYKNEPEKQQKAMLQIYREHKVNPFGGCLPLLLPMPILFAMFFVFANTIEFRGVPFLWLPDLARHDPLFIIPVLMGLSMFMVSKIGMRGLPPNPQSKMMLYVMPVMMVVLFFRFASGLNLYYTVQNLFSIPQQWLISQRRLRQPLSPPAAAKK